MKTQQKILLVILAGVSGLLIMACGLGSVLSPANNPASGAQPPASQQPAQEGQQTSQPAQGGQQTTRPAEPQGQAPSLSEADVYKALEAASAKMLAAGPRHATLVTTMTFDGKTTENSGDADIVPPNIHEVLKSNGAVVGEFYVINGDLYSKGDTGWTLKPGGGKAYVDAFNGIVPAEAGDVDRTNGKAAGLELIGGKPALKYNYDSTVKSLNITSNFTVWVDQASGLMVRMQTLGAKGTKSDMTVNYDPGISITLPPEAKAAKPSN